MEKRMLAVFIFILFFATCVSAQNMPVVDFVQKTVQEKAKGTGHIDLFDEKTNKVRNLDLLEINPAVESKDNLQMVHAKFRDVATGDIVTLTMTVAQDAGSLTLKDMKMTDVAIQAAAVGAADPNHAFTDQEIQDAMQKYLKKKSQFTGSFDIFDEKLQKMRNLEIGSFDKSVRRFGTRYISRVEGKDLSSKETVLLDLSVDNKDGNLEVKSVKIFGIK